MPKGKPRIKEIIGAHFHRQGLSPGDLEVLVADRLARGGTRTVRGREIAGARRGFLVLADGGEIPLHRVRRILSKGVVVFARHP